MLEHSEAKLLFVGKLDDWPALEQGIPEELKCIYFPFSKYEEYESWEDLINAQKPVTENIDRPANYAII